MLVALGKAKETEACNVSCEELSTHIRNKKSSRKAFSSSIRVEKVSNPETKALAVWDEWEEWQPCSRTCGTGTRIRLAKLSIQLVAEFLSILHF